MPSRSYLLSAERQKKNLNKLNSDAISKLSPEARRVVEDASNNKLEHQTMDDINIIMNEVNPLFEEVIPVESIEVVSGEAESPSVSPPIIIDNSEILDSITDTKFYLSFVG